MTKQAVSPRPQLLAADDAVIEDAIAHADPMVLRGLLYQLTGDPEVAATGVKSMQAGFVDLVSPATRRRSSRPAPSSRPSPPLPDHR